MRSACALLFSLVPLTFCLSHESIEELKDEAILPMEDALSDDVEVDPPLDVYTPAPVQTLPEEHPLTVNLKNPAFVHGVISTSDGGVIDAPGIRIQAQNVEYTNKIENG